jgi:hypothetical protein
VGSASRLRRAAPYTALSTPKVHLSWSARSLGGPEEAESSPARWPWRRSRRPAARFASPLLCLCECAARALRPGPEAREDRPRALIGKDDGPGHEGRGGVVMSFLVVVAVAVAAAATAAVDDNDDDDDDDDGDEDDDESRDRYRSAPLFFPPSAAYDSCEVIRR